MNSIDPYVQRASLAILRMEQISQDIEARDRIYHTGGTAWLLRMEAKYPWLRTV